MSPHQPRYEPFDRSKPPPIPDRVTVRKLGAARLALGVWICVMLTDGGRLRTGWAAAGSAIAEQISADTARSLNLEYTYSVLFDMNDYLIAGVTKE